MLALSRLRYGSGGIKRVTAEVASGAAQQLSGTCLWCKPLAASR
jgi:hypothetical protein